MHILNWIKEEIKNFPNQELIDIAFPCKMAKQKEAYKNVPIFSRALDNTPEFSAKIGDSFYYIKCLGKDETKKEMVKAFNEDCYAHIKKEEVDWQAMLERNIIMKLDVIFEAMKWQITDVYIAPPTSQICLACGKEKSVCRFNLVNGSVCHTCKTCQKEAEKPPKRSKVPKEPISPLKSSISEATASEKPKDEDTYPEEMTNITQHTDIKEVPSKNDLVTGTPITEKRKRGRPRKTPIPKDLNLGNKTENDVP
jgi:hypothetical protein